MELSKELLNQSTVYPSLDGKEDLRFELFDWLRDKGLTVRQAINLLDMTRSEIVESRRLEMDNMKL